MEVKKRGRPKGHKITQALVKAEEAARTIEEMDGVVSLMNPQQKLLFESIMSGDDELISCLKSGHNEWFTGITKKLDNSDGTYVYSSAVTLENVRDLTPQSYSRLLSICRSQVRKVTGEDDYRIHTEPIKEYIKKFAPLALGTIIGIATGGEKEENRLKAAKDILDRAGEAAQEPEKDTILPLQVNIMLTQSDGTVVDYNRRV